MTNSTELQTAARKVVYLLVVDQGLRPGESMSSQALQHDLQTHGMDDAAQTEAIDHAIAQGWLHKGYLGEVQVTEMGFRIDFAID